MSSRSARLLIADPDPKSVEQLTAAFSRDDCYLVTCSSVDEALELSQTEAFDAVICDVVLTANHGGRRLVTDLRKLRPKLPVIAMAENPGSGTAIEAIKSGAYDFLPKPVETDELKRVVSEAIAAARRMSKAVVIGEADTSATEPGDALIGRSRAMLEVYKALGRLTATPVTVLIRGETGTGIPSSGHFPG